jgi:hypothetical protein
MNRKSFYRVLAAFFIVFPSFAQQNKQIVVQLSPVVIQNGKYIFEGQRVSFEALMIPLMAVHDDQINKKLKVLKTTRVVHKIAIWLPLLYFTAQSVSGNQQGSTYQSNKGLIWGFTGVMAASLITIPIMKRGIINRYNEVVLQPRAQFSPSGFTGGFVIRF